MKKKIFPVKMSQIDREKLQRITSTSETLSSTIRRLISEEYSRKIKGGERWQ